MSKPDGGPAFPTLNELRTDDNASPHTKVYRATSVNGMTLRDWLAGQALVGLIPLMPSFTEAAASAYAYADALLAARET